jgi:VWFA-related protein
MLSPVHILPIVRMKQNVILSEAKDLGGGTVFPPPRSFASLRMTWVVVLLLTAFSLSAQEFREEITVERIIVDAYVIDSRGNPIRELQPKDFKVKVDGKPAEIESLEWQEEGTRFPEGEPKTVEEIDAAYSTPPPEGRLFILFIQNDFQRADARMTGMLQMDDLALRFVNKLQPNDRVAVVSFDSHLRLRQDFTNNRSAIERAVRDSVKINDVWSKPQIVHSPALFTRISLEQAQSASSSEQALLLIGNALMPVPGPKIMVMFGWGLGVRMRGYVTMTHDYGPARRALEQSRTSVFAMDITAADGHDLAFGLGKVAGDTGGFYASTYKLPEIAMGKLERALQGHYVLVVKRPPELPRGVHTLEVNVPRRGVSVHARTSYVDR